MRSGTVGRWARIGSGIVAALALAWPAGASLIDLSTSEAELANSAYVARTGSSLAQAGTLLPFLRTSGAASGGVSEGYNSSARPLGLGAVGDLSHTRDIKVGQVPLASIGGRLYYQFALQVAEPAGSPLVSLDSLLVFTSPTTARVGATPATLGTLRYDLDAGGDRSILIDAARNTDWRRADMFFYLPADALAGRSSEFLHLYARFGDTERAEGPWQEWSVLERCANSTPPILTVPPGTHAPEPGVVALLGMAGLALAGRCRRP